MNRASETTARNIITRLLPSPTARAAWSQLATQTIKVATSVAPDSWSASLFPDLIRINVGQVAVLNLRQRKLGINVVSPVDVDLEGIARKQTWRPFKAVDIATEQWQAIESALAEIPPQLIAAHLELVRIAARAKSRSPFRRAHSPGVVRFLQREVGVPLLGISDQASGLANAETIAAHLPSESEREAISVVTDHYTGAGWRVTSVERQKIGYDLLCISPTGELHVEVKGARGAVDRVILTSNELTRAFNDSRFVLAIVDAIATGQPRLRLWSADQFRRDFTFSSVAVWARLVGAG